MRFYYSDGTFLDDSPTPTDIQIIVQKDEDRGIIMTHSFDFYIWREEDKRWVGCDIYGLFRYLQDTGLVLFGHTIPNGKFAKLYQEAKAHRDALNAKSST